MLFYGVCRAHEIIWKLRGRNVDSGTDLSRARACTVTEITEVLRYTGQRFDCIARLGPNEKEISDGYRERAPIEVEVF